MPGSRLSHDDRQRIAAALADGLGYAEIARQLGRPTSTISREVGRNGGPEGYEADSAQLATARRARRSRTAPPPEPPAGVAAHGRDPAAVHAFTEQFAALLVKSGVPRMPARVLTCLFATDSGNLTAADLVQHLRVSPASVSKAITYLEALGLVRRARESGQRRERYHVDDDAWLRAWTVDAQAHTMLADAALRGAETLGDATPAGARVAAMGQFFARLADDMAAGPHGGPDAATVDDALTVLAALVHAGAPRTPEQLASALRWAASRVSAALRAAEQHPDIGDPVALHSARPGSYTIAARRNRLTATQREALGRP